MKRLLLLIFFILICTYTVKAQFVNETEVTVKAVAVTTGEQPAGVIINITAIITPGNGKIFVSTSPFTQIDMQGSAQLAALTACDVLGMDFLSYNFFYTIESGAPIVGGPSAGAVMTIATMAALKNLKINENVFMTGMIYPDGSIGPVGGIPQKLEAASKNQAEVFLIPEGQRNVVVHEEVVERKGPFVFKSIRAKTVDLIEMGNELGVDVVEVSNVENAFVYYTGYSLAKPEVAINISIYSDILKNLADKMKKDAMDLLKVAEQYADSEELDNVMNTINMAKENYERENYYTSTSQYFSAKIEMRYIVYRHTLTADNIDDEFRTVEEEINYCLDCIRNYENMGVNSFQLIGAAEERIKKSEEYLERAKTSRNFDTAIQNLAFARERIESAKAWLSLLKTIKEDIPLDKEQIKRRAQFYLSQAESLIIYASTIGGSSTLIGLARESSELANKQIDDGFYAGAVTSAIDSIVKTSISIELIGLDETQIEEKIKVARVSAEEALSEVQFVTPILPAAYFEFAETMDNSFDKLMYYKLSERLSEIMLIFAKENPEKQLIETVPEIPSYERTVRKEIEVPGFGLLTAISAVLFCYFAIYIRKR
jgi:uncharacterized protein